MVFGSAYKEPEAAKGGEKESSSEQVNFNHSISMNEMRNLAGNLDMATVSAACVGYAAQRSFVAIHSCKRGLNLRPIAGKTDNRNRLQVRHER